MKEENRRNLVRKLIKPADWLEVGQLAFIWGVLLITGIIVGVILDTIMYRLHVCR